MIVSADFSDLGHLNTLLAGAANRVTDQMPGILDDVAEAVVADAKNRAPVDTGELRDSIEVTRRAGNAVQRERWVGSRLRQAYFQEVGTSRHPPQPFITPAANAGIQELYERMAELGEVW